MSISISASLSAAAPSGASNFGPSAGSAAAPKPQPITNPAPYTVKLSETEQIYQLYNQGQRVSQIATALNLSVSAVNNYLNISGSS